MGDNISIMSDSLNIKEKGQSFIDNFIELWLTGARTILGQDPDYTDAAPIPLYESGKGVWFAYGSDVGAGVGQFCYSDVTWALYSQGKETELNFDYDCMQIHDSNRNDAWNTAWYNYWDGDIIDFETNDSYIINNQIDFFGLWVQSNSSNNPNVSGFRYSGTELERYISWNKTKWLKADGNTAILTATNCCIINQQAISSNIQPVAGVTLQLPRGESSFWTSVSIARGGETNVNNYYDTIKNHNENNNYYTTNGYTNYYNTYNYYNSDGVGFDIGVGPAGVAVNVVPVAGVVPVVAPTVDFDDLINILQPIADDLNNHLDGGDNIVIHELNWYLGYEDVGDFYIEPLHQYDTLSPAPSFDGSIDFGDIPHFIGESANSYLSLLGTGMSGLLCGCFITALIVRKMGR